MDTHLLLATPGRSPFSQLSCVDFLCDVGLRSCLAIVECLYDYGLELANAMCPDSRR